MPSWRWGQVNLESTNLVPVRLYTATFIVYEYLADYLQTTDDPIFYLVTKTRFRCWRNELLTKVTIGALAYLLHTPVCLNQLIYIKFEKMVKAFELRSLTKEELVKTLTDLRKELADLHVAKVTDGAATKVTKIKGVRKSIARVLTVHNQQQKAALVKASTNAKYVPKDLRMKKTRAIRRALSKTEQAKKTHRQRCRLAAFPKVKYAIKASA